jgi:outer membrane biosynthesis protein TonB
VASAAVVIALVRAGSDEDARAEVAAKPAVTPAIPAPRAATPPSPAPSQPPPAPPASAAPPSASGPGREVATPGRPSEPRPSEPRPGVEPARPKPKRADKPRDRAAVDPRPKPTPTDADEPSESGPDGSGASGTRRASAPSVKDLAKAVDALKSRIHTCAKENGVSGSAAIRVQVEPDGKIAWAAVREGGGAFQSCVSRVVREIRLPPSERGGTLVHSVSLPDP